MSTGAQPGFPPNYATVTPSNATVFDTPSNIRVGTAGAVHFVSAAGQEGTETLADGEYLGCQAIKIFSTSTTATNISRYW